MARTTGPLMSLSASGSVAKTLTFAHWKGRPYVRQLVTPSNPRSAAQYYTRAMMTFLSQVWANLNGYSPNAQASWADLGHQGNFSPFNAFVKTNMMRWTQLQGAECQPDGAGGGGTDNTLSAFTATPGVRQIAISFTDPHDHNGFGVAIVADPTNGATPAQTLTRIIIPCNNSTIAHPNRTGLIAGLDPGTYSVASYQFHTDGTISAIDNATQGLTVT